MLSVLVVNVQRPALGISSSQEDFSVWPRFPVIIVSDTDYVFPEEMSRSLNPCSISSFSVSGWLMAKDGVRSCSASSKVG